MEWLKQLNDDPLPWLLEPDPDNPGVRYFALRDLLHRAEDEPEVRRARATVMASGPVPAILEAQYPAGYWIKADSGYSPKYRGTVWQVIFLAELGADPADERVRRGCDYLLEHSRAASGAFAYNQRPVPSGAVHCLNGNLIFALLRLGYAGEPRLEAALEWLARAITGEGQVRFYKSGTAGPSFACGVNLGQPCGWGATKAARALSAVPPSYRTSLIERAVEASAGFLLSHDPARADYPFTERVSSTWFKFGFPLSYWSDVLETVTVLVDLGYGGDPRLANAFDLILGKQDERGRWTMENSLNGKLWADVEAKGRPSKWVTLRALRALRGRPAAWETV
ncbi:MAG: nitrogen fixation protein NifH [Anaerolineae bacterium]